VILLSEEQNLAASAKDKRIIINSVAGSGKTTVAQEIIRRNNKSKILYLVYNKSMQLEALDRFGGLQNVEIRTTYSMAYAAFGYKYKHRLQYGLNLYAFARLLGTDGDIDPGLQRTELFFNLFELYLASRFHNMQSFIEDCVRKKLLSSTENTKGIATLLERVFEDLKDLRSNMPITHQFYFKLWHLSKPTLQKYDIVIVDEYQDSSAALVDIIDNNKNVDKIVVIGDENQNIYGFANTINGLAYHSDWVIYNLSTSYRISNKLAKLLEKYISITKSKSFYMIGENENAI
jgi:F-box protein, helicase, 18